ncbi:MAG: hypothetical protein GX020_07820 [Firmicutes bacterium]|nr:hypothetical protein [Bacillota bacterium]
MKSKSLALVVALIMLAGISTVGLAASNPFADVPADHWAYDSIVELAAVGLIEGYPDGTFGGSRMMTRYEAAMVFARALARLENLVEDEFAHKTAGLERSITAELMAEIEKVKENLTQVLVEELANIEVPVVEKETIIEKHIEQVAAPFEVTPEVEAVINRLVLRVVKEQLADIESAVLESVKDLALEVEDSVDALTVVNIVESMLLHHIDQLDGDIQRQARALTRESERLTRVEENLLAELTLVQTALDAIREGVNNDVVAVQNALDAEVAKLTKSISALAVELENELALIGVRVDKLETIYKDLDSRVTAVEGEVAGVKDSVDAVNTRVDEVANQYAALKAQFERVNVSGRIGFEASLADTNLVTILGKEYSDHTTYGQKVNLDMSVKASDSVLVNAYLRGDAKSQDISAFLPREFGVEVLSEGPIKKAVFGTIYNYAGPLFNRYTLDQYIPIGARAEIGIGGLGVNVLGGRVADKNIGGVALSHSFAPELGFKGSVTVMESDGPGSGKLGVFGDITSAVSFGAFGNIGGINYDAAYALDLYAEDAENNDRIDLTLSTEIANIAVKFGWGKVSENFGQGALTNRGLVRSDANTKYSVDANTSLYGAALGLSLYGENADSTSLIKAHRFALGHQFDLFVPVSVSGVMAKNTTLDETNTAVERDHKEFKVGVVLPVKDTGLALGTSYAYVVNRLTEDWRNIGSYSGVDVHVINANVDYDWKLSGDAVLNLGYDYQLALPKAPTTTREHTHTFTAGYNFTDGLKFSLAAERFARDTTKVNQLKAELGLSF